MTLSPFSLRVSVLTWMMLFWSSPMSGAIGVVSRADIESILLQCPLPHKLEKSGETVATRVIMSLTSLQCLGDQGLWLLVGVCLVRSANVQVCAPDFGGPSQGANRVAT